MDWLGGGVGRSVLGFWCQFSSGFPDRPFSSDAEEEGGGGGGGGGGGVGGVYCHLD